MRSIAFFFLYLMVLPVILGFNPVQVFRIPLQSTLIDTGKTHGDPNSFVTIVYLLPGQESSRVINQVLLMMKEKITGWKSLHFSFDLSGVTMEKENHTFLSLILSFRFHPPNFKILRI